MSSRSGDCARLNQNPLRQQGARAEGPRKPPLLALLAQAHANRETRLFQAGKGLPVVIWVVLSFYALVLVLFVLFAGVESRGAHILFTSVFAVSVALVLLVLRMLDYPFEGALALGYGDFTNTIERVTQLMGPAAR